MNTVTSIDDPYNVGERVRIMYGRLFRIYPEATIIGKYANWTGNIRYVVRWRYRDQLGWAYKVRRITPDRVIARLPAE